jgi:hypothetical protein
MTAMISNMVAMSSLSSELAESSIDDSNCQQQQASLPQLPVMAFGLEALIARRKWKRLRHLLASAGHAGRDALATNASRDVLHVLYASNPPLDVVTDLLGLCGSRAKEIDSTGRTPLHIAAASGAPLEVVEPLLGMHPAAAGLPDLRGETPLMLAAAHGKAADKTLVKLLIRASPHTVNAEDDEGCSALEYALLSEVPRDTFRMLQKACARERKARDDKLRKERAAEAQAQADAQASAQQAAFVLAERETSDAITEQLAALNAAAKTVQLGSRRERFAAEVRSSARGISPNSASSRSLTGRAA